MHVVDILPFFDTGFNRFNCGPDVGSYYHKLFVRGKPSLAKSLFRQKIKGCGHKTMKVLEREPDFYTMPPPTEDSQDNSLSNIFAPSTQKYLPVTAVVPPPDLDINTLAQSSSFFESKSVSGPYQNPTPQSTRYVGQQTKSTQARPLDRFLSDLTEDSDPPHGGQSFAPSTRYVGQQTKSTQERPLGHSLSYLTEDSGTQHGDPSFVNELNETIFMHELAMGCSILCQLRRGDSTL